MKKITSIVALLVILVSCTPKNEFTVKGTITGEDLNGKEIYLSKYNEFELLSSDTVLIKGNQFRFKGIQEEPAVYYIFMDEATVSGEITMGTPLLIKPGKITVDVQGDRVKIGGNEENIAYQQFIDEQYPLADKMVKLQGEDDSTGDPNDIYVQYFELLDQLRALTVNYLLENVDNPLGEEVFITSYQLLTPEEIKEILDLADESFRSNSMVVEILAGIGRETDESPF
ncbi:MAG: DUF4369 domain-containing protein [Candidatus Symbiothrix sp.]|jgi:hypothetical protein|nr:DUF4369 domain-containing protein [Candidatus Symbiothrix sp.]